MNYATQGQKDHSQDESNNRRKRKYNVEMLNKITHDENATGCRRKANGSIKYCAVMKPVPGQDEKKPTKKPPKDDSNDKKGNKKAHK